LTKYAATSTRVSLGKELTTISPGSNQSFHSFEWQPYNELTFGGK
jgi:hypothetical protein